MPIETESDIEKITQEQQSQTVNVGTTETVQTSTTMTPEERFQDEVARIRAEKIAKLRGEGDEKFFEQSVKVHAELNKLEDVTKAIQAGQELSELQNYKLATAQRLLVDLITEYGINLGPTGVITPSHLSLSHLMKWIEPQDVLTLIDRARKAELYELTAKS